MLSDRWIRMIEAHAEELTPGAEKDLQSSPRTRSYHRLPAGELQHRVYEVYRHLGHWLEEKTDYAIRRWYRELGATRCAENIPLSEVIWALVLTKYYLWDCIRLAGLAGSAVELYPQQELDRLVGYFFDRAIYYAADGYEGEAGRRRESGAARSVAQGQAR